MQTYFPYSQIITNICTNIKQSKSRYAYTSAWQVFESNSDNAAQTSQIAISEIYY